MKTYVYVQLADLSRVTICFILLRIDRISKVVPWQALPLAAHLDRNLFVQERKYIGWAWTTPYPGHSTDILDQKCQSSECRSPAGFCGEVILPIERVDFVEMLIVRLVLLRCPCIGEGFTFIPRLLSCKLKRPNYPFSSISRYLSLKNQRTQPPAWTSLRVPPSAWPTHAPLPPRPHLRMPPCSFVAAIHLLRQYFPQLYMLEWSYIKLNSLYHKLHLRGCI